MHEYGAQHVVTVGDQLGLDVHDLAEHCLGRVPTAVDLGPDREDYHA
jgi:hypothetical protein